MRERVNGVLALEIMGFAILLAFAFWISGRKTASRLVLFQRESAELRALNQRLQREIAERERAEKNLEVAEQTLQQSSKLAALGEMSAAVSHELNQPLAAMKTYLAGARLLLQRKRPRRGAVVVPADRRPDRPDGRDHPPAEILCPQGRRGVRAGGCPGRRSRRRWR